MLPEIQVQRFEKDTDLSFLNEWLRAHGKPEVDENGIPTIGLIAFYAGNPVAAAFLRRCEGHWGLLEGMTSNPDTPAHIRHAALDAITTALVEQAKLFDMTMILAWTLDSSTLVRSARHGFRKLPETMIVKDLRVPRLDN